MSVRECSRCHAASAERVGYTLLKVVIPDAEGDRRSRAVALIKKRRGWSDYQIAAELSMISESAGGLLTEDAVTNLLLSRLGLSLDSEDHVKAWLWVCSGCGLVELEEDRAS